LIRLLYVDRERERALSVVSHVLLDREIVMVVKQCRPEVHDLLHLVRSICVHICNYYCDVRQP
jgi:hypothetical protein